MKQLLNTLYVTTKDTRHSLSNNGVEIEKPDGEKARIVGTTSTALPLLYRPVPCFSTQKPSF